MYARRCVDRTVLSARMARRSGDNGWSTAAASAQPRFGNEHYERIPGYLR
jgi:hypothetical protein